MEHRTCGCREAALGPSTPYEFSARFIRLVMPRLIAAAFSLYPTSIANADDPRNEFAAFYRDAPTYEAVSYYSIRGMQQGPEFAIVHHMRGRLCGRWFDLRTASVVLRNEPLDFERERNRPVEFPEGEVFMKNTKYQAEIRAGRDGRSAIRSVSDFTHGRVRAPIPEVYAILGDPVAERPFADMIDDRKVTFTAFGDKPWNGGLGKCAELQFTSRSGAPPVDCRAAYYFDPRTKRCIGQEHWLAGEPVRHLTLEYADADPADGGIPLRRIVKSGDGVNFITEFVELKATAPIAEDEFKLSHYGLPEPHIASEGFASRWVVVVAVVCALMAGLGFFLRRKRGGA